MATRVDTQTRIGVAETLAGAGGDSWTIPPEPKFRLSDYLKGKELEPKGTERAAEKGLQLG